MALSCVSAAPEPWGSSGWLRPSRALRSFLSQPGLCSAPGRDTARDNCRATDPGLWALPACCWGVCGGVWTLPGPWIGLGSCCNLGSHLRGLREAVLGQLLPNRKEERACSAQFLSLTKNKAVVLSFQHGLIVRKELGSCRALLKPSKLQEKSCFIQIKFNQSSAKKSLTSHGVHLVEITASTGSKKPQTTQNPEAQKTSLHLRKWDEWTKLFTGNCSIIISRDNTALWF